MTSPFPGMNPYLEHPDMWPEVHHMLISVLAETLTPQLLPKYRAAIDKRVYFISSSDDALLVGIPDVTVDERVGWATKTPKIGTAVATPASTPIRVQVPRPIEIREGYLEIRETGSLEVITVIEILSPTNKRPGEGRRAYAEKRERVLGSSAHFVEIDLLRSGSPLPLVGYGFQEDYRVLVSRQMSRPGADLYAFNLRDPIPAFPLPLRQGDVEPILDLQAALGQVYDRLSYDQVIDYYQEPVPPLAADAMAWADALLRDQGRR